MLKLRQLGKKKVPGCPDTLLRLIVTIDQPERHRPVVLGVFSDGQADCMNITLADGRVVHLGLTLTGEAKKKIAVFS